MIDTKSILDAIREDIIAGKHPVFKNEVDLKYFETPEGQQFIQEVESGKNAEANWIRDEQNAVMVQDPASVKTPCVKFWKDDKAISVEIVAVDGQLLSLNDIGNVIRTMCEQLKPSTIIITVPVTFEGRESVMTHFEMHNGYGLVTSLRFLDGGAKHQIGKPSVWGRFLMVEEHEQNLKKS